MNAETTDKASGVRIAFCLMIHDNPAKAGRISRIITDCGHEVFIHLDASVGGAQRDLFVKEVAGQCPSARFVPAFHCEWGSWNLVAGTLSLVRQVLASGVDCSHLQLLSGADLPIQNLKAFEAFLARNRGVDFIESVDITRSRWVVHGPEIERFRYFYPFNWRRQRGWFDACLGLQELVGVRRRIPLGIRPRLGSQWWTLRRSTCESLMRYLDDHPQVVKFFKSTLIPDECFFQSLVPHLVGEGEIVPRTLTLYRFNGYGKPFVFYDDHAGVLPDEAFFFARKVSPSAKRLEDAMFARAVDGPAPAWPDHQAGRHSLALLVEAAQSFRFCDPMIGHIGESLHRAIRNPGRTCAVLICEDRDCQMKVYDALKDEAAFRCDHPADLPPWRQVHDGSHSARSYLAGLLARPGPPCCFVTTLAGFPSLAEGLAALPGTGVAVALVCGVNGSIAPSSSIDARFGGVPIAKPTAVMPIRPGVEAPVFPAADPAAIAAWVSMRIAGVGSGRG